MFSVLRNLGLIRRIWGILGLDIHMEGKWPAKERIWGILGLDIWKENGQHRKGFEAFLVQIYERKTASTGQYLELSWPLQKIG